MKIRVTYDRIFDSKEFYRNADPSDLEELTSEQFETGISDYLKDCWDIVDELNFEQLEEDDSK